jgi:hypothetical protein
MEQSCEKATVDKHKTISKKKAFLFIALNFNVYKVVWMEEVCKRGLSRKIKSDFTAKKCHPERLSVTPTLLF